MALWWVNGDLLLEGLCHTQVYCTQSSCPCISPLLTCTSSGDTQTQLCLSLCGVSGSWCSQGLFEPSEWVWALILNAILPLLLSFWGFSALGCQVSPHRSTKLLHGNIRSSWLTETFCKMSSSWYWTPLHQNLIYWVSPTAALEHSLRALWDAASRAAVIILSQIKLNPQLSSCSSFF